MGTSLCQEHDYFPHHVGDMWQYLDDSGVFSSVKFEGDSIDENGYTFIHALPSHPYEYWTWKFSPKGDSAWNRLFGLNSNFLLYRFPMVVGETWRVEQDGLLVRVEGIFTLNLFGTERTVVKLSYYPDSTFSHWYWTEKYAIGIGQIWYGNEVMYRNLIGCVINSDTLGYIVNVEKDDLHQPEKYYLYQNYPNPFNPMTRINYQIPQDGKVNLKIYDILGNEVKTLLDEHKYAGRYEVEFNASTLPSGVYFYQLRATSGKSQAGDFVETKKMILMK